MIIFSGVMTLLPFRAPGLQTHRASCCLHRESSLNHCVARILPLLTSLIFSASLDMFIFDERLCPYSGLWQEAAEDLAK